jgi:hypothetical protein
VVFLVTRRLKAHLRFQTVEPTGISSVFLVFSKFAFEWVNCRFYPSVNMANQVAYAAEKGQIYSYAEKCAAVAETYALPKEKALELLQEVSGRPAILEAVYNYWTAKRKRTGKPCLRRLQPPPAPNDNNPFNGGAVQVEST